MGGQQSEYQSTYARMDFVEGKFREHDKQYISDMNRIKESLAKVESISDLTNRVIALEAKIDMISNILMGKLDGSMSNTCDTNQDKLVKSDSSISPILWIPARTAGNRIGVRVDDISRALVWDKYLTKEKAPGNKFNYKLTKKGESVNLIKVVYGSYRINQDCLSFIKNLVKKYKNVVENLTSGEDDE